MIWEVAQAALRGQPAFAEQLVEPELRPQVRRWDAALGALEGRSRGTPWAPLGLASLRGRVAAEASWALIVDARRGDRDAEALERVEAHLQGARRPAGATRSARASTSPARPGILHSSASVGSADALSVDDALATLTVEVVVDALVFDGAESAAHVLDSASSAGVPTTVALRYWRARVDGLLGDTEAALGGFRAVFELAPLSWYACGRMRARTRSARRRVACLGQDAALRGACARRGPGGRLRAGRARRAHSGRTARAQLARHASGRAPTSRWPRVTRVLGDDDGAAWTLARHGDAETMTEVDVAAASSAMWQAVFPTPFDKAVAVASAEAGVARSWLWAVARRESAFDPGARSGAGALGLMQVLPATAREVARRAGWSEVPTRRGLMNVETNARSGAAVLAAYHRQLGPCWEPTLMAYASGPARALRWMPVRELPADIWRADALPDSPALRARRDHGAGGVRGLEASRRWTRAATWRRASDRAVPGGRSPRRRPGVVGGEREHARVFVRASARPCGSLSCERTIRRRSARAGRRGAPACERGVFARQRRLAEALVEPASRGLSQLASPCRSAASR